MTDQSTLEPTLERVAVTDLKPHPRNYRRHPDDQLAHIAQSLREHGQYRNVVVASDYTILAGHGVCEAAPLADMTEVDVMRLDVHPDSPQAIKILTGDNELSRLAEVDDRLLTEHLKQLAALDQLLGTGFDEQMVANLVYITRHSDEVGSMDEAAHWAGLPEFEQVARHKIVVMIHCDTEDKQQELVDQLGITITMKNGQTWAGWWPPRPKDDVKTIKFE